MDCCPAHCVSSGRRGAQWIHLSLQKAGLPVTCSGHWAKHLASHPLFVQWSQMLSELAAVEIAVGVTASPSIDLSSIGELLRSVCTLSAAPWSISQTHRSNFPATQHLQTCSCVVACYAVSATCLWLRGRVRTLPPAQQHLWHLMLLGTLCWDVLSLKGFWKGSVF